MLDYTMPNSLVTFDRFWGSSGTAIDQPAIVGQAGFTTLVPARSGRNPRVRAQFSKCFDFVRWFRQRMPAL